MAFIFKEKSERSSFRNVSHLARFKKFKEDKKIVTVVKPQQLLPYVISQHADVTVSINISSAALEAGIPGKCTLMYYPSMTGIHPLEQMAKNRVVFDKLPKLMGSLKNIYSGKGGDGGLLGKARVIIDPYADGSGPGRISRILNLLLTLDLSDRETAYAEIDKMLLSKKEAKETVLQ